jgi:hypothetical protein
MPNDVYTGNGLMRRIIGVIHGSVIYSNGGDSNSVCKLQTLKRWQRRHKATLEHRAE